MKELLYLEIPTPDTAAVKSWLHTEFTTALEQVTCTPDGILVEWSERDLEEPLPRALSIMVWSLQRTTYLKAFRWGASPPPQESQLLKRLKQQVLAAFPLEHPQLPPFSPHHETIFAALAEHFPKTVTYFQRMPNGEADLQRVYWWEKRWRDSVKTPKTPRQVIFQAGAHPQMNAAAASENAYDLIYVGGALGAIHAAVMANLGYRVLLIERLPFGRMHREWNISRQEFQSLIDLGLFTEEEFESFIACEYADGFSKFFDANTPIAVKASVLHTPSVLNVALNSEALLKRCGEKLTAAGGVIWDRTEFQMAEVGADQVTVQVLRLPTDKTEIVTGKVLVDAMGTASPIAWQLNNGRAFDSVCPTVGACISGGFEPGVWDSTYGDVLFSHGDVSRGRQLIWELFPGKDNELTIYLFHYHQVHRDNPGSLLAMYEDFFHILPEYRRCNVDKLTWRKPTFGYIPGHFSLDKDDRTVAFDRLVAIGDAASLQSPLVFTGFGSLIRNLPRLTHLLDLALKHRLLKAKHLNHVRAFQSNVAVTWLFSKGMMVPTGKTVPPARINAMLNTFFGILDAEDLETRERFIKDRASWGEFNRMALKAATKNPALLNWIWQLAGPRDMLRWVGSYLNYTLQAFLQWLFGWLTVWLDKNGQWIRDIQPALFFWLQAQNYHLTYGMGQVPVTQAIRIKPKALEASKTSPMRRPDQRNTTNENSPRTPSLTDSPTS